MRNLSIECLRILFMCLIVTLHLMQFGYGEVDIINSVSKESYLQLVLIMLGKLGVPGFVFITGFYGVKLSSSRLASLWVQTSFYVLLSTLLMSVFFNKPLSGRFVLSFLPMAGGYWFVEDYIILMLFSPFINTGLENINKKQLQAVVIALVIIMYGIFWMKGRNSAMSLLLFFSIYVIARSLALYPLAILSKYRFIFLVISLTALIFFPIIVHYSGRNHLLLKYVITYFNIFTLVAIISLFSVMYRMKWCGKGNFLTQNVLAVYLIHCSPFGQKIINEYVAPNVKFSIISALLIVLSVYVISALVDEIRKMVCKPIELRLGVFIEKYLHG